MLYDFRKDYVSLEDWINFEAEIARMFALVSELNRCSEIMGNTVRNTGLSNPLLYLLFALDYTSPASQGILLQEDTTNADPGIDRRGNTAASQRGLPSWGQSVHKDSRSKLKAFFSSTVSSVVMRKTSKPSVTLKQDLENMDAFASNRVKVMVEKNF